MPNNAAFSNSSCAKSMGERKLHFNSSYNSDKDLISGMSVSNSLPAMHTLVYMVRKESGLPVTLICGHPHIIIVGSRTGNSKERGLLCKTHYTPVPLPIHDTSVESYVC